jgi:hypothetical protein
MKRKRNELDIKCFHAKIQFMKGIIKNMNNVMNVAKKKEYKIYVCKRLRLYTYLHEHGFIELFVRPDKFNPHYYVWIFRNSEELQNAIKDFYSIGY